jgi:release factor glutamine methyltransferase
MSATCAAHLLPAAISKLRAAGVADPAIDVRRLLAFAMDVAPDRLLLHMQDGLDDAQALRFVDLIDGRVQRRPVSQLIGMRQFYGRNFKVTQDVLDPRPETEMLVEAALAEPFQTVLDLGTGSGAILLTLLAERTRARGLGVDISRAALDVARDTRDTFGLAARAELLQSDWLDGVGGSFDLITCNPPYIDGSVHAQLEPEPRLWEPQIALTPGADGLHVYRTLAPQLLVHLAPRGRALFEVGAGQANEVAGFCAQAGLSDVEIVQDFDGRGRVVTARRPI